MVVNPSGMPLLRSNAAGMQGGKPRVAFIEDIDDGDISHALNVQDVLERSNGQGRGSVLFAPNHIAAGQLDIDSVSDQIERILNDPAANIRTINLSYGISRVKLYDRFILLSQDDPSFREVARQLGKGNISQGVINFVDQLVDHDPSYRQTLERYRQLTRVAAERGVNIVVSAGNENDTLTFLNKLKLKVRPDAALNLLAQSDHVISVGAIDDKGTADTKDDTAASFSSVGGSRFRPTIAANGVNVFGDEKKTGTSFSAPQVSGTVARMLEANPNLTFQQIKAILQSTAQDNPNIDNRAEGAGTLNTEAAIRAAAQAPLPRRSTPINADVAGVVAPPVNGGVARKNPDWLALLGAMAFYFLNRR